jgi:hypothetical protein
MYRKKSSFFYSDDMFNYQLKSIKFQLDNDEDSKNPLQTKFQTNLPPGIRDKDYST